MYVCINAKISHALATLRFFSSYIIYAMLYSQTFVSLSCVCVCACACDERENKRHYSFIGILIASSFFLIFLCTPTRLVHASTPPYTSFYTAFIIIMYFFYSRGKKVHAGSGECCCSSCRGVKLYCSTSPTVYPKDHANARCL